MLGKLINSYEASACLFLSEMWRKTSKKPHPIHTAFNVALLVYTGLRTVSEISAREEEERSFMPLKTDVLSAQEQIVLANFINNNDTDKIINFINNATVSEKKAFSKIYFEILKLNNELPLCKHDYMKGVQLTDEDYQKGRALEKAESIGAAVGFFSQALPHSIPIEMAIEIGKYLTPLTTRKLKQTCKPAAFFAKAAKDYRTKKINDAIQNNKDFLDDSASNSDMYSQLNLLRKK